MTETLRSSRGYHLQTFSTGQGIGSYKHDCTYTETAGSRQPLGAIISHDSCFLY
jgi:hypothetical protein